MRCLIAFLALVVAIVPATAGFAQADAPKGLFLMTDYPSQTVRAGEVTTIRLKLNNAGLPPEPVALSLSGVPAGWKVDLLGGGRAHVKRCQPCQAHRDPLPLHWPAAARALSSVQSYSARSPYSSYPSTDTLTPQRSPSTRD